MGKPSLNRNLDPRMEGCAWLIPYLTVCDAEKSMEFYTKVFGFDAGEIMRGPDGKPVHCDAKYQGQTLLMFAPKFNACMAQAPAQSHQDMPMGLYVYTKDVDALYLRAVKAGAVILQTPQDMFWGDRTTMLQDPDGYCWTFAKNVGAFDPSKLPSCLASK